MFTYRPLAFPRPDADLRLGFCLAFCRGYFR